MIRIKGLSQVSLSQRLNKKFMFSSFSFSEHVEREIGHKFVCKCVWALEKRGKATGNW